VRLSEYEEDFGWFSSKASDVARSLALAGIAFVWVFKITTGTTPRIPQDLVLPALLFAVTLAADLLQYVSATVVWGLFCWYQERQLGKRDALDEDPELTAPVFFTYPQLAFFWGKMLSLGWGYSLLILYLRRLWIS